ncbi:DUF6710 family protein [Paraclostridium bifermentans]|uniref:DUF6710 family protein n=1 Tax=Paraclostridium bifermentans TaxID=1490 RepID=UPI0018A91DF7|nr:DUF6710 family protein [Paraclostridium bifermentans]
MFISRLFNKKEKQKTEEIIYCNNIYIKDNLSDKEKFDNIMSLAKEIIDNYSYDYNHDHPILDFIRILGRRIQSDYMGYLLYSGKEENSTRDLEPREAMFPIYKVTRDEDGNYIKIDSLIDIIEYDRKINISTDLILPWPWRRDRIYNCLTNIGKGREWGIWKQDDYNHWVNVWLPMGIAWVGGGNHSITVGIVQGGELKPEYYSDISRIYKYIECDGENFRHTYGGEVLSKVKSPEFAAIFEIGRIMCEKGISFIN